MIPFSTKYGILQFVTLHYHVKKVNFMTTTNRSNNSRSSGTAGRSHGQSRARQTAARQNSGSHQKQSSYSGSSQYRRTARRRRRRSPNYGMIAIVGVILMIAIVSVVYGIKKGKQQEAGVTTAEETTQPETELEKEVKVDGITITGLSRDAAKQEILKKYQWGMKVQYQDDTYEVANLMESKVDALLEEIYAGKPKESYTLDTSGLEEAVQAEVDQMKARWNKAARNGSISSYDAASGNFVFTGEAVGVAIDGEKLAADMLAALSSKDFDAVLTVSASEVQPEISMSSAKEKYKVIGTLTTNTTANSKRNTNVRLACEALNGTIVGPGQEFSFNETIGQRTAEKGYQSAAAYNNGEVVQEIGGGVCQVSTTLYGALVRAGLKISFRRSHTFEPSYVTPGQDAAISWGSPDFKFINTSSAAIGIRASYSNQTATVSIYGIPVLEEGVTQTLESKKIEELDMPAPTYEEDPTLQPGEEVVKSKGSSGSKWETRLIIKKNGEVISNEVDHVSTYKGHAPVIRRNTSGMVLDENGQMVQPSDSVPASEGESASTPGGSGTTESAGPTEENPGPGGVVEPSVPGPEPGTAPAPSDNSGSGNSEMPNNVSPISPDQPGGVGSEMTNFVAPKPEE